MLVVEIQDSACMEDQALAFPRLQATCLGTVIDAWYRWWLFVIVYVYILYIYTRVCNIPVWLCRGAQAVVICSFHGDGRKGCSEGVESSNLLNVPKLTWRSFLKLAIGLAGLGSLKWCEPQKSLHHISWLDLGCRTFFHDFNVYSQHHPTVDHRFIDWIYDLIPRSTRLQIHPSTRSGEDTGTPGTYLK